MIPLTPTKIFRPSCRCLQHVKIVKKTQPQLSPEMMKYWVMYSILTLYDMSIDPFVSWLPFYDYIKLVLLLYMLIPQSNGATILYDSFADPFLKKQEEKFATKVWPKIRGNSKHDRRSAPRHGQAVHHADRLKELERLSITKDY